MRYKLLSVFFTQLILGVLLVLLLFPQDGILFQIIRIISASLLLFYLPGYRIGYIFFAESDISAFERFMINFLISTSLVILIAYYLYFTTSNVSTISIYLISGLIILLSIAIVLVRRRNGYSNPEDS